MYEVRPASISEKIAIEITFESKYCYYNNSYNFWNLHWKGISVNPFVHRLKNKISQIEREATPLIPSLYYI